MEKNKKLKPLYWVLFRLMDVESIMWWIAEKLIYPVALSRRKVAEIINKKLEK